MYAIIDTEGSGLFRFTDENGVPVPADAPGQPRLAQFAAIICDADMNERCIFNLLVRPDGWEMSPEATLVNGLTTERLLAEGQPVTAVLDAYTKLIEDGYAVIAWNAQHDCKQLRAEMRRGGRDDMFAKTRNWCAMRATRGMKIKKANGKGGQPRLEDACVHFGIDVEPKPHNALQGARACLAVVRALRAIGTEIEPEVHYARNHPGEAA